MTQANHPLIDLADPSSVPPNIFFQKDGHINAAGHRYVASGLVKWINSTAPHPIIHGLASKENR
jgi:hypothetical protein